MKGLLLKDLYNLRQQWKIYLLIIAVWLVISILNHNAAFFGGLVAMFSILVPITSIAYDEKSKWDRYALTMPISRGDMAMSKYMLALLCAVAGGILSAAVSIIMTGEILQSLLLILATISASMIFVSIILPIILKFGVEKGRMIMLIVVIIPIILSFATDKVDTNLTESQIITALGFTPLAALVLTVLSYYISKSVYSRKEL